MNFDCSKKLVVLGIFLILFSASFSSYGVSKEFDSGKISFNLPYDKNRRKWASYVDNKSTELFESMKEEQVLYSNIKPTEPGQALVQVKSEATEYLGNVYVRVDFYGKQKPNNASKIIGVHSYYEVRFKDINEDQVRNSKLTFRVRQSWLEEYDREPEEIVVKKYRDDEWVNVNTRVVDKVKVEEKWFYKYETETDPLGFFAVALRPRAVSDNVTDRRIIGQEIGDLLIGQIGREDWNQLIVGKSAADIINAEFTQDTMKYRGKTYESEWRQEDYGLIHFIGNQTLIIGTHRYGTRAAAMIYDRKKPKETTKVHWVDENDNNKVEYGEVSSSPS